jgi:hypothetical protein
MPSYEISIADKLLSTFNGKEGNKFQSYEIVEMVVNRYPGTNKGSILPADYCYNKTNKGNNFKLPYPLFEWHEGGTYKYLGPNFKYEGLVYWKGTLIGEWKMGIYEPLEILDEES